MTASAIALNRELLAETPSTIRLGKDDRIPHVTLAMDVVARDDLDALARRLDRLAGRIYEPIPLLPESFRHSSPPEARPPVTILALRRTPVLAELHARALAALAAFSRRPVEAASFCEEDPVAPSAIRWVDEFRTIAAGEAFEPHITLGHGVLPIETPLPAPGRAVRLGLFWLGDHCTCRTPLWEQPLPAVD